MKPSLPQRVLAEGVGSYALVVAGCGAIIVNTLTGTLSSVGVAATFGLIILVMVAATEHLSGAHFNPAVTVAFAFTRHFPWREVPAYVGAQLAGAIAAAGTLRLLFGMVAGLGATVPNGATGQAFGVEFLLTAMLMFVIAAVATDPRSGSHSAAPAIGATVALAALWGGPISGASMNPARSLGPALVAGIWNDHWLYWLAPLLGAVVGAWLYQALRGPAQP